MNNILEETRFIINKYNIRANKSLGQNFLINENVVSSIVECSNITKEDLVIEIGPGLGTLTKELLENAGKVVCIELDTKMLKIFSKVCYKITLKIFASKKFMLKNSSTSISLYLLFVTEFLRAVIPLVVFKKSSIESSEEK